MVCTIARRRAPEAPAAEMDRERQMKTITLEMPDGALELDWCSECDFPAQLRLAAAIFWHDPEKVSGTDY